MKDSFFSTKIDVKVLGYVHGLGVNDPKPQVVTKENIVEVKLVEKEVKNISDDKNYVCDRVIDYLNNYLIRITLNYRRYFNGYKI